MRRAKLVTLVSSIGVLVLALACGDDKASMNPGEREVAALDEAGIKLRLGLQMYGAGRYGEAIGLFEQTLRVNPANYEARYWRAAALMQAQRHGDALVEFDKLLAERPNEYPLKFMRATTLTQLARHAEALAEFDRLALEQPGDPELMVNRAAALNKLGRGDEALASVDKGLALFPDPKTLELGSLTAINLANGHSVRAEILASMARYEDALAALERGKPLRPETPQLEMRRAEYLSALGRDAEAGMIYDELLLEHPADAALRGKIVELRGH